MESLQSVLKSLLDAHAGDPQLLAVQLQVSASSVQRWVSGDAKPRPSYEARIRKLHADVTKTPSVVREGTATYRVTPHHPMITEAVDQTLKTIREILHKRGHLSSRNQALDELSKLLLAHVESRRKDGAGICRAACVSSPGAAAVGLKRFVDSAIAACLPQSLEHSVEHKDIELCLKPHENDLALEIVECFETLHTQTSSFSFNGIDVLNDVFGKFLADSFVDEKELGQYLTPPEVVRFMVGLAISSMADEERETLCNPTRCHEYGLILDPSCGVGSFLAECLHSLHDTMEKTHPAQEERDAWARAMLTKVLVGIDKSERMIRLALTNMAMFGLPMARLHLANALARKGKDGELMESLEGKARLILTNPPFGAAFQENDIVRYRLATQWAKRVPARLDSETLFVERYIDWLAPGGHLVAILPDSVLTNKGVFEDLRCGIAPHIELCNVVSLPSVTFGAAGTNTKTSVVHFRKQLRSKHVMSTAFAVCNDIGFTVATRANHRTKMVQSEGDLPRILAEIVAKRSDSAFVRWIDNAVSLERWDAQHHASLSTAVEQRLAQIAPGDIRVSDVAELIDERVDPRGWATSEFTYIEISDIDSESCTIHSNVVATRDTPSRARKLVHAGDVLVSTVRPERGTVGVVGAHLDGAICTTGLAVLRPRSVNPLTLAALLKTEFVIAQLIRNNVGIAYPAIDEACLVDVLLPISASDLDPLEDIAGRIAAAEGRLHGLRKDFQESIYQAGVNWRKAGISPDSKHRQVKQTTFHRRSDKSGSDSRDPDAFRLEATHTA